MKRLVLMLGLAWGLAAQTAAPDASEERKNLLALMDLSGARKAWDQILNEQVITAQMRGLMKPETQPAEQRARMEEFITAFGKEFARESNQRKAELEEITLKILAKYYTAEDVKALVAFYQTPLGRKLTEVGPKVVMESMTVGQQWGQELGRQIGARLGKEMEEKARVKP